MIHRFSSERGRKLTEVSRYSSRTLRPIWTNCQAVVVHPTVESLTTEAQALLPQGTSLLE